MSSISCHDIIILLSKFFFWGGGRGGGHITKATLYLCLKCCILTMLLSVIYPAKSSLMASGYSSFSPQAVSYLCDAENMPLFCNLYNTSKVLCVLPTSRAKIIWAVCLEVCWSAFKLITCTFTVQVPETFKAVAVTQRPCPSRLNSESHICFIFSDEKCYQPNEIGTQTSLSSTPTGMWWMSLCRSKMCILCIFSWCFLRLLLIENCTS